MKAIVLKSEAPGRKTWQLSERPVPQPGPGEVQIRVRAASLNYRDLAVTRDAYIQPSPDGLIPLADGAGEISAVGAGVTQHKVGDRVCTAYFSTWLDGEMSPEHGHSQRGALSADGVLAQYTVVPATGAVPLPKGYSFEEAATLPCAAVTAWSALFESGQRVTPGNSVLVLGTGAVSLFAAQFAAAAGLRVIATTSSADKAARLHELGVQDVIDYRKRPEWQEDVLQMTEGRGVDHVIEVGGAGTFARSLQATRFGGVISVLGFLAAGAASVDPMQILLRHVTVQGLMVGSVRAFEHMNAAIDAHGIKPIIHEVFPLERASAALAQLAAATHFGKLVVRIE